MREYLRRTSIALYNLVNRYSGRIKHLFVRLTDYVKVKKFRIFWFLIFPPILYLLLFSPFFSYKREVAPDKQGFYTQYFLPDPDINRVQFPSIAEIINTPINLDWYDICIENNAYITLNGEKIDPKKLGESDGIMTLEIFPLQKNVALKQYHDFLKEKNSHIDTKTTIEYSFQLSAKPNSGDCVKLKTDEKGFMFLVNSNVKFGNQFLPPTSGNGGSVKLIIGNDSIEAVSNNSRLIVKASFEAIILKLIIFWLLLDATFLLVIQIKKYVFENKGN